MTVKTPRRRRRTKNFYESALSEAEKTSVQFAREVDGIDEEVALLRLRLRTVVQSNPKDFPLMLRGLEVLKRLLEVRFRLGEKQSDALGAELAQIRDELIRIYREEVAHDGDSGNR
jgi:hypothetical protein